MADDISFRDVLLKRAQALPEDTGSTQTAPSRTELLERTGAESAPVFARPLPQFSPIPGEGQEGPPRPPLSQAGPTMLRGLGGMDWGEAGSRIASLGKEIPRYGWDLVGNFFNALKGGALTPRITPPTREGREAGGEFVGQLSDIGMAASGGGAVSGPVETPRQAGRMATGFGTPEPQGGVFDPLRRPPPPGPQLALPPPAIPPAAGTRALPPPSVDIPGRPIPTPSPGDVRAERPTAPAGVTTGPAGPRAATPEPFPRRVPGVETQVERDISQRAPTGAIPQPGATMRTQPEPGPRAPPTAAEAAGAAAGRDLPPRAPGTEGRPGRAAPVIPEGAERGPPSLIADAFASNDPTAVDRGMARRVRSAIGMRGARRTPELDRQDMNLTTAIDSIIEKRDLIRFKDPKDPTGNTLLRAGRLPRNLDEFSQSISYLKSEIYKAYDYLAGNAAVRIDLRPTVDALRRAAADPTIEDFSPAIRQQAMDMADRLEQRGSYTPLEAQNAVEHMNQQLKNFFKKVPGTQEIYSHPSLINQARGSLLNTLNTTMNRALGSPQYQALRNRYASLASIEDNVGNALSRQMARRPGIFTHGFNATEALAMFYGIFHGDPKIMGSAALAEATRQFAKFYYGENHAIASAFRHRAPPSQLMTAPLAADIAAYLAPRPSSAPSLPPPSPPYVGPSGM